MELIQEPNGNGLRRVCSAGGVCSGVDFFCRWGNGDRFGWGRSFGIHDGVCKSNGARPYEARKAAGVAWISPDSRCFEEQSVGWGGTVYTTRDDGRVNSSRASTNCHVRRCGRSTRLSKTWHVMLRIRKVNGTKQQPSRQKNSCVVVELCGAASVAQGRCQEIVLHRQAEGKRIVWWKWWSSRTTNQISH